MRMMLRAAGIAEPSNMLHEAVRVIPEIRLIKPGVPEIVDCTWFGLAPEFPHVGGHEFCGIVEEVGGEVTRWKRGDRQRHRVLTIPLGPRLIGSV